ncbi:MAG: hypothetical protein ABIF85_04980 [Nanoarchaeota archaeon]|nr:hypothetical protein [Nanoarchaeota archaeon]MBU4299889.1 hypothetical protein [Nanoarchaeota archaeon]MBU4452332.1 hypothetical protein [Nanoarchaeota archaeon]MCG2724544.1 hypothetical protein [archaeon]
MIDNYKDLTDLLDIAAGAVEKKNVEAAINSIGSGKYDVDALRYALMLGIKTMQMEIDNTMMQVAPGGKTPKYLIELEETYQELARGRKVKVFGIEIPAGISEGQLANID